MRRGNTAARDMLMASVGPMMLKLATQFSCSAEDIDELMQEGQIRLLQILPTFDPRKARLTTYSHQALVWVFRARQIRRARQPAATSIDDVCEPISSDEPIDDTVDRSLRVQALHQLIDGLPLRMGVIVRRRMAGDTLAEIAIQFGITKERVRQIESRAHSLLRRAMAGCA